MAEDPWPVVVVALVVVFVVVVVVRKRSKPMEEFFLNLRGSDVGQAEYPPPGKEGQMDWCWYREPQEAKAEYICRLQYDLSNTVYWSGNFLKDYKFYIAQRHPVLGILLCHPHHPWNNRERFQMALVSILVFMPISVLITKEDTVLGVLLRQLSIADTRCPACAPFWICINLFFMDCFLIVGLVSIAICFLELHGTNTDLVKAFTPILTGELTTYLSWFPIWFFFPCKGFIHRWWNERKALLAQAQQEAEQAQKAEGGNNDPVAEQTLPAQEEHAVKQAQQAEGGNSDLVV